MYCLKLQNDINNKTPRQAEMWNCTDSFKYHIMTHSNWCVFYYIWYLQAVLLLACSDCFHWNFFVNYKLQGTCKTAPSIWAKLKEKNVLWFLAFFLVVFFLIYHKKDTDSQFLTWHFKHLSSVNKTAEKNKQQTKHLEIFSSQIMYTC